MRGPPQTEVKRVFGTDLKTVETGKAFRTFPLQTRFRRCGPLTMARAPTASNAFFLRLFKLEQTEPGNKAQQCP
jgi:hypothetical protein